MKKLIPALAVLGVIGAAALWTGCGGGDDNNNNNVVPPTTDFAPTSLTNMSVTLTENVNGVPTSRDVTFAPSGNSLTLFESGTTNAVGTGTYVYTKQGNNNGQVVVTSTDSTGATSQVTYNLAFTSATTGTYTFTTSSGQTGSGTFTNFQQVTAPPNGGGTTPPPNGGGTTPPPTGNTQTPASLAGKVIDFTATGQGNERLTFAATGNTVTSDAVNPPNNVATYTYTAGTTGSTPSAVVVTFPNGDNYNLQMAFTDNAHGTWSGTQHFDNADHPVPAGSTFTIQNP